FKTLFHPALTIGLDLMDGLPNRISHNVVLAPPTYRSTPTDPALPLKSGAAILPCYASGERASDLLRIYRRFADSTAINSPHALVACRSAEYHQMEQRCKRLV